MSFSGKYDRRVVSEALFTLDGKPFRLDDYPFYVDIYQNQYPQTLMMCGRQVAKSTTMVTRALSNCTSIDHFKMLYVATSKTQASMWSTSRLDPMIQHSPAIRTNFALKDTIQNRLHKRFSNGSEIRIMYAKDDADRIRGVSADENDYDEVQDMVMKEVVPVASETMANSEFGWTFFAGTPKTLDNNIEVLWQDSTQDEWIIPCEHCGKWSIPNTVKMIGKHGVICSNPRCGKYLNPRRGQWHSFNPRGNLKGYHISQLCLPRNSEEPRRWARLLRKIDDPNYSEIKFRNEVLGVSDSLGSRLLSRDDLKRCERPYTIGWKPSDGIFQNVRACVAGIDWSGGGSKLYTSRTVIWVWGIMLDGTLKTMYRHIFETRNPARDVREILQILNNYNVKIVVGDAGGGALANAMVAEEYGLDRVAQVQYSSSNAKKMRWNGEDRYIVDKTSIIDSFMQLLLREDAVFPSGACDVAFGDILAEFEHITKNGDGKRIWTHSPHAPDDALHAMVFGWLASQVYHGAVKFYPYVIKDRIAA